MSQLGAIPRTTVMTASMIIHPPEQMACTFVGIILRDLCGVSAAKREAAQVMNAQSIQNLRPFAHSGAHQT